MLRVVLVTTHNGDRPAGTLLSEVHKTQPGIARYSYVTLSEKTTEGEYRIRYRRIHFQCGCVGTRQDGPKVFIPRSKAFDG